jgi:hypothetical protein
MHSHCKPDMFVKTEKENAMLVCPSETWRIPVLSMAGEVAARFLWSKHHLHGELR